MKKLKPKPQTRAGRDTHLYLDDEMWAQLQGIATAEDRSVTATVRVLIKEALRERKESQ
jgi:hypothetical protein